MITSYYLKGSIAAAMLGALVYGEVQGDADPHAQYIAVSPTNNLIASGGFVSNVAASTVTYTYQPSPVTLEFLLPHDHLVIQDTALTLPTGSWLAHFQQRVQIRFSSAGGVRRAWMSNPLKSRRSGALPSRNFVAGW